jgi:Ca2+-transporting ATPase
VLWVNFAITVPIAIALGFDQPSPGLMARTPRPLQQPVLSRAQWLRIVLLGVVMAAGTLLAEAYYGAASAVLAATMGATVFSLYNVFVGLSSRDETRTAFTADFLADRRQLGLYGLALLLTVLATELPFLQRVLGTTSLSGDQWLQAIVIAASVLVVDEAIKLVLRRRRAPAPAAPAVPTLPAVPAVPAVPAQAPGAM